MSGKLVWGYDTTNKVWLPILVDSSGRLKVDMSNINLDDLGDVSVASPTDGYVLYWDAGSSLWKAKAVSGSKIQDADADTKVDTEESADEDHVRMDVKGVEAFDLDSDGILTLAKQASCGISSKDGQTIPDSTWTTLEFSTTDYDTQSEADLANNRITVKKAGTYLITARAAIQDFPADHMLQINLRYNGTGITSASYATPYITAAIVIVVSIFSLSAGDYVDSRCYQDSGSPQNLSTATGAVYLRTFKLA